MTLACNATSDVEVRWRRQSSLRLPATPGTAVKVAHLRKLVGVAGHPPHSVMPGLVPGIHVFISDN
jgi:hypothetical protein